MGRIDQPADFARLIVANRGGQPVRIEDVGHVEDTWEEARGVSRLWVKGDARDVGQVQLVALAPTRRKTNDSSHKSGQVENLSLSRFSPS